MQKRRGVDIQGFEPLKCFCLFVCLFVCLMVFNATLNNISVISWRSVLLVEPPMEDNGGPRENHRPVASH